MYALHPRQAVLGMLMLSALAAIGGARASDEGYAEMLGYLAQTRIDGQALTGSRGAIAVNMSAGDLNQQANLRAIAVGANAQTQVDLRQKSDNDTFDLPLQASATIGGSALSGAGGIASINQASGSGNAEFNAVSLVLAEQGIREAPTSCCRPAFPRRRRGKPFLARRGGPPAATWPWRPPRCAGSRACCSSTRSRVRPTKSATC